MKNTLIALALATAATSSAFAAKVATVDLEVIKQKYNKAIDGVKVLGKDFEGAKAEMNTKVEKLKKLQGEAEAANKGAEDPVLSETARADKKKEAQAKIQEFLKAQQETRQYEQQVQVMFQQRGGNLDREIIADVRAKSEVVAKEKGYELVIPKAAALYASDTLDISNDVVAKLNAAYAANPVNTAAPVAPAAPAGDKK